MIQIQNVAGSPNATKFVLATSYFNPVTGKGQSVAPIMKFENVSDFAVDGSNFIFRRLTSIGQASSNSKSVEWFGFAANTAGGPNLQQPEIAYTSNTLSNASGQYQITTSFNNAERNPKIYNNATGVLCSENPPYWQSINFNAYEGINLANTNASGKTMYGINCYTGQGT